MLHDYFYYKIKFFLWGKVSLLALVIIFLASFASNNVFAQEQLMLSPEMFGAKGDAKVINDAQIEAGSNSLFSASAAFTNVDINKTVYVNGAGKDGSTLIAIIKTVINSNSAQLQNAANQTVSSATATYGTDATTAFIKINQTAREAKVKKVLITLQPHIYLTRYNCWLAGITNVEVDGNNASIMCTNGAYQPNNYTTLNSALHIPTVFDNSDNNNYNLNSFNTSSSFGYRINTAKANSSEITLQNGDSAKIFKQGNWILVYGYEYENTQGYPPAARYFDFVKIKNVDLNSGKITFYTPIKYDYDSGWPDSTWAGGSKGLGAPRIINCDRPSFHIIESLTLRDLHLLPFPGWVGKLATETRNGRLELYGAIDATVINLSCTGLYIGTSKKIAFVNSVVSSNAEPDKELSHLIFDNCTVHEMVNALGIDTMELKNSTFTGSFGISPRVAFVDGCTFLSSGWMFSNSLAHFGGNGGTDFIHIGNNKWNWAAGNRKFLLGPGGVTKLKIESIINENTVTVSNSNWALNKNGRQVRPGETGFAEDNKNSLKVTRVYQYQPGLIAISGTFLQPTKIGQIFTFSFVPHLEIGENQYMLVDDNKEKCKNITRSFLIPATSTAKLQAIH